MSSMPWESLSASTSVQAHLLGQIEFDRCLALQERLVREAVDCAQNRITLLVCEHPQVITIGRSGSAADVQLDAGPIRHRQIEVRWVKRGGGAVLHTLGQLAIYPIVPLRWHGLTVAGYLDRLQTGILRTLDALGVSGLSLPGRHGVWGRTGQLAALGVAVRSGVAWHGAFLNVCPAMGLFRLVETDSRGMTRMSCLVAERGRPVRMTSARAELVRQISEVLGCDRYHLHTGHPLLARSPYKNPSSKS